MIVPALLNALFVDSYEKIKTHTAQITHAESIQRPDWGGNSIHWIVGHIVVARCNFSMWLDLESIWDWPTCEHFIPGSGPTDVAAGHISFETLLTDLDRTQERLSAALVGGAPPDMSVTRDEQTIGEQMAMYAAHEAYHAGQLEILCMGLRK